MTSTHPRSSSLRRLAQRCGVLATALAVAAPAFAEAAKAGDANGAPEPSVAERLMFRIQRIDPNLDVTGVSPSPMDGIFRINLRESEPLYATADGRYMLQGSLYRVGDSGGLVNVWVSDELDALRPRDIIRFAPSGRERASVTVFTDIDCGYCRRFHTEVPVLNSKGVRVDYLAFPRSGIGQGTYTQMVSAWCADDPKAALTDLKRGRYIAEARCPNPVADQYQLGQRIGVRGTPAVYDGSGRQLGGYLSAPDLLKALGISE